MHEGASEIGSLDCPSVDIATRQSIPVSAATVCLTLLRLLRRKLRGSNRRATRLPIDPKPRNPARALGCRRLPATPESDRADVVKVRRRPASPFLPMAASAQGSLFLFICITVEITCNICINMLYGWSSYRRGVERRRKWRAKYSKPQEKVMRDPDYVNRVKLNPARTFKSPMDVVETNDIEPAEKLAILNAWESDERALLRAEDEGMGGGEHAHLHKVQAALDHLR